MRDPRTLEDLIDAVELYGVYVASLTGNIDLTTEAGISAARSLVNQRNQESRNTSRLGGWLIIGDPACGWADG
jgi:site-specific DNA recombinase